MATTVFWFNESKNTSQNIHCAFFSSLLFCSTFKQTDSLLIFHNAPQLETILWVFRLSYRLRTFWKVKVPAFWSSIEIHYEICAKMVYSYPKINEIWQTTVNDNFVLHIIAITMFPLSEIELIYFIYCKCQCPVPNIYCVFLCKQNETINNDSQCICYIKDIKCPQKEYGILIFTATFNLITRVRTP